MSDTTLDALRAQTADDPDVPANVRAFLKGGAPLEEIRLDARGRWWHQGEPFQNQRLIDLFCRSVRQTAAGTWLLVIPPYTYPIIVERTGWFATHLHLTSFGQQHTFAFTLLGGEHIHTPTPTLVTDGVDFVALAWTPAPATDDAPLAQSADESTAPTPRIIRLIGAAYDRILDHIDETDGGWEWSIGPDLTIPLRTLPEHHPLRQ